jgi:hypothetical protein
MPAWCDATVRRSSAHGAIHRDSSTDEVERRSPRGAVRVTALVARVASSTRWSRTARASAVGSPASARSVSESSGSLVGRGRQYALRCAEDDRDVDVEADGTGQRRSGDTVADASLSWRCGVEFGRGWIGSGVASPVR